MPRVGYLRSGLATPPMVIVLAEAAGAVVGGSAGGSAGGAS